VAWLSEDDWFFKLSKYSERLKQYYREHPDWVRPRAVYNEMMALLEEGLDDLSISRTNLEWGIPVPGGGGVIYVWFDALLNYITALDWPDGELFKAFWPASVQLIGKEIARFHTLIWPAILWGIGQSPPRMVFAHGWITIEGQKIGKSLGNAVDPFALAERFGSDAIRYFLLREAPFGNDFSYSEEKIVQRYNSDLGNDLGNLLRRSLAMLEKYRNGLVPQPPGDAFGEQFADLPARVQNLIFDLSFRDALEAIWELVVALNRAIDERKPWILFKEGRRDDLDALLYSLCEGLRWLAILLAPFMPARANEIWLQLGMTERIDEPWSSTLVWGGIAADTQTRPGEALFPRIEATAVS
jgi:methionyl-tRNA synthetase